LEAFQTVRELATQTSASGAHDDLVGALKRVFGRLSPDALDFPPNSELRQLFTALCNLLTAAINPEATKKLLMAHVRGFVCQARGFAPKS
jgi:hypothetical protein